MPGPLHWTCRCGKMKARVAQGSGASLSCYCKHCRAYAHHMGVSDILDEAGGSDLYQTLPEFVTIKEGAEHLACLRMTEKGPLRWYASCCNTPMANTAGSIGVPFVGFLLDGVEDAAPAGEIKVRVHSDGATGPLPGPKGSTGMAILKILGRAMSARLRGSHKTTPFFQPDGAPVAKPRTLTPEERATAYGA